MHVCTHAKFNYLNILIGALENDRVLWDNYSEEAVFKLNPKVNVRLGERWSWGKGVAS